MTIRNLRTDDVEEISRLFNEWHGFEPEYGNLFMQISNNSLFGCGLFLGEKLVSMAFLSIYYRMPCNDTTSGCVAELNGVYTTPEHRGNDFASICCSNLISLAKAMNVDYIHCDAKKEVFSMYEKLGFIKQDESEMRIWLPLEKINDRKISSLSRCDICSCRDCKNCNYIEHSILFDQYFGDNIENKNI